MAPEAERSAPSASRSSSCATAASATCAASSPPAAFPPCEIGDLVRSADARAEDYGGAIVRVKIVDGERPRVSLVLPVVEALASSSL